MNRNKIIIVSLLLIFVSLYLFAFNMKPLDIPETSLMDFSKDGFVESELLSNTDKLVSTNGDLRLYLDETTSFFRVVNTSTGVVWESNPSVRDPWELDGDQSITNSALDKPSGRPTVRAKRFNDPKLFVKTLPFWRYPGISSNRIAFDRSNILAASVVAPISSSVETPGSLASSPIAEIFFSHLLSFIRKKFLS